ncbi:hypothetical protein Y032_0117g689 [Ancylostoma ceylanicum]|uniref:Uncharacterized protein n=1 Tax=Ancylostoma ceylanicum TaxID=53326 RepID=A0A016TC62_9BILA|nr:hypothetical protein Y032_0117g689 [Ancylostoma ceylanicum]
MSLSELMAYLIHFNTARSECIYKMNYGSRFETEHDIDEPGTSGGTIESNGLRMITVPRDDGNVEELWVSPSATPQAFAGLERQSNQTALSPPA